MQKESKNSKSLMKHWICYSGAAFLVVGLIKIVWQKMQDSNVVENLKNLVNFWNNFVSIGSSGNAIPISSPSPVVLMVTLGFGLVAVLKWFEYFVSFSTKSALINAITPVVLTYLTFQWDRVFVWIS